MYEYRTEVSALTYRIALACIVHDPASVSDITMLCKMNGLHGDAPKKWGHDYSAPDYGPMRTLYPLNLTILTDKGYQGAANSLSVLYPKKNHRMDVLH